MKVIADGEPEEIKKLLNAIGGSKEQQVILRRIDKNTQPLTKDGTTKDSHVAN